VTTVADRQGLDAYHNKHCWGGFRRYQHRWPWTTSKNPKNKGFSDFLAISGCHTVTPISRVNCAENTGDRPRQPVKEIKLMLPRVRW